MRIGAEIRTQARNRTARLYATLVQLLSAVLFCFLVCHVICTRGMEKTFVQNVTGRGVEGSSKKL
jgi:hypothetical protein